MSADQPPETENTGLSREALWAWFWGLFLLTPVVSLITIASGVGVLFLGVGTLGAGFVLARLCARTHSEFVVGGVLFSAGVFVVYIEIMFLGCLLTGAE